MGARPTYLAISTATAIPDAVQRHYVSACPPGMILNLGAGMSGWRDDERWTINVDHVAPLLRGPGSCVVADARWLPFRPDSFAGGICKDVLEHLADPLAALLEARRCTRPDGVIVVTVPRAVPRAVWDDFTHVRGFTSRALLGLLATGGWHALHAPRRIGGLPGADRLHIVPLIESILRLPGIGHLFGTNWIVRCCRASDWPQIS